MTPTQPKAPPAPALYQLPDGSWIDPRMVEEVKMFGHPNDRPYRVCVVARDGAYYVTPCGDSDSACALRDKVATEINAVRAGAAS